MNAQQVEIYQRIQQFSLDAIDANLPFSKRLARDNGWTLEYAQRVIQEYKKFVFLAVVAGHPVTPSEQVDQVWHLHLLYTQSYWKEFCPQVLQMPLHHNPTKGGQQEQGKFNDWYTGTLASYERFFQQAPPADIWSPPQIRFGREIHFQRVNTQQNWIIPKPDLSQLAAILASKNLEWLALFVTLGIVFWELPSLAANASTISLNNFFSSYSIVALSSFIGFFILRSLFVPSHPLGKLAPSLLTSSMLGLFILGAIQLAIGWADLPGLEFLCFYTLTANASIVADRGMNSWLGVGLYQSGTRALVPYRSPLARVAQWLPLLSLFFVYGLGIARIGLGLYRGKPVGFLAILCLGLALYLLWRITSLTQAIPKAHNVKLILYISMTGLILILFVSPPSPIIGFAALILIGILYGDRGGSGGGGGGCGGDSGGGGGCGGCGGGGCGGGGCGGGGCGGGGCGGG